MDEIAEGLLSHIRASRFPPPPPPPGGMIVLGLADAAAQLAAPAPT